MLHQKTSKVVNRAEKGKHSLLSCQNFGLTRNRHADELRSAADEVMQGLVVAQLDADRDMRLW